MKRKLRNVSRKSGIGETGSAMILALILLTFGSLLLPTLLQLVNTGFEAAQVFEDKTYQKYAAGTGVDDGLWQIRHGDLDTLFTNPPYDEYDYNTAWNYDLSEESNGYDVNVTIQNIWIPKDIAPPEKDKAREVIEAGKLIIAGSIPDSSTYKIKISYYPEDGEDLKVNTIGVWLPAGYSYENGSSNLETNIIPSPLYHTIPSVEDHHGGQAIIWTFSSVPLDEFPGVNTLDTPITAEITFNFNSTLPERIPLPVSWVTTSGVDGIELAWDSDTRIYLITSDTGKTSASAHIAKSELRELGWAILGDYRASGASLMEDTDSDADAIRDLLLNESDALINDIPSDAEVTLAYLYWSGWFGLPLFQDVCENMNSWNTSGNYWTPKSGRFEGHVTGTDSNAKFLTLKKASPHQIDLSSYAEGEVTLKWEQYESGQLEGNDRLYFALSADDGASWSFDILAFSDDDPVTDFEYTVPQAYLTSDFTMRFNLYGFTGEDEYAYIDEIILTASQGDTSTFEADTSVVFKIDSDQVYFDNDDLPQKGLVEIVADKVQARNIYDSTGKPYGYSYSCKKEVTELIKEFTATGDDENHPGNGTFTVGGVDADTDDEMSYAGWSMIIVYSNAESHGHQLYIYDDLIFAQKDSNVDFDNDGDPGGIISGFITPEPVSGETIAAKLTCFVGKGDEHYDKDYLYFNSYGLSNAQSPVNNVWNSQSPGLNEDGIDIDTFNITWESDVLDPGDTSASIDMPTKFDSYNLIYIILSFRSEVVTGDALDYLIEY